MSEHHWQLLEARCAQVLGAVASSAPPLPAPSPCVSLCLMHPSAGWCDGCLRTLAEIGQWSAASDADKHRVWAQLPERLRQRRAMQAPQPLSGDVA